jgi:hypothetical protein
MYVNNHDITINTKSNLLFLALTIIPFVEYLDIISLPLLHLITSPHTIMQILVDFPRLPKKDHLLCHDLLRCCPRRAVHRHRTLCYRRRRAAAIVTLPPPPQPPRCCHCAAAVALCAAAALRAATPAAAKLPPTSRQASADVALSRCRRRRSLRAAATSLPPWRCAPPPHFALPPLPPPSCGRRRDGVLPPLPNHQRCCHRAAAVALCTAAALCGTATAASALLHSRCRRRLVHRRNALPCRHRC